MRDCLDCKYEPDWGAPVGKEHRRQSGNCRWDGVVSMPQAWQITKYAIVRYLDDDSGTMTNCATWAPGNDQ